jgi:hypothetical protein
MRIVGSPVCAGGGAAGDPTDALLADQSHSIPDNLVALLGDSRAWNCSVRNCRSGNTAVISTDTENRGTRDEFEIRVRIPKTLFPI